MKLFSASETKHHTSLFDKEMREASGMDLKLKSKKLEPRTNIMMEESKANPKD